MNVCFIKLFFWLSKKCSRRKSFSSPRKHYHCEWFSTWPKMSFSLLVKQYTIFAFNIQTASSKLLTIQVRHQYVEFYQLQSSTNYFRLKYFESTRAANENTENGENWIIFLICTRKCFFLEFTHFQMYNFFLFNDKFL